MIEQIETILKPNPTPNNTLRAKVAYVPASSNTLVLSKRVVLASLISLINPLIVLLPLYKVLVSKEFPEISEA